MATRRLIGPGVSGGVYLMSHPDRLALKVGIGAAKYGHIGRVEKHTR
jgi:hypothetical protein